MLRSHNADDNWERFAESRDGGPKIGRSARTLNHSLQRCGVTMVAAAPAAIWLPVQYGKVTEHMY